MYDLNQNQTRTKNHDCALDKIRAHPENASKSVDHILFNNILPTIDSTGRVDEHMYLQTLLGGGQREKLWNALPKCTGDGSFRSFLLF
jgi:hypothetical protein